MSLILHREPNTDALAEALAGELRQQRVDPFVAVEVVVGSRGMERWLRHKLAAGPDRVAASLAFPFPRAALDAATACILDLGPLDTAAQRPERQAIALVTRLRAHLAHPDFAMVRAYLHGDQDDVAGAAATARELVFAREVADVLDRMQYERPEQAVAWAADIDAAPTEHRWLARLLAESLQEDAPAARQCRLLRAPARPDLRDAPPLHLFGLSTLGKRDIAQIDAIARSMTVHLYLLAPSSAWWEHIRTAWEARAALRQEAADPSALAEALHQQNPLLAALGKPSRDLQGWLEEIDYLEPTPPARRGVAAATTLGQLHSWIDEAGDRDALGPLTPDPSLELHACFGALRQVEALRDRLLALLDQDLTLTPRDIVVMTPDIETYAPLCSAVFARRGVGANGRLPALPAHVADLGLRSTNPLAALLLWLLDASEGRLTASMVCDLAGHEAVRLRFGLQAEDVESMRALAAASGMRWGEDADARRAADQPPTAEHTLRFGLERLALGALCPDQDARSRLHEGADADEAHALPLTSEALRTPTLRRHFGILAQLTGELEAVRSGMSTPRTPQQWRALLRGAVDRLGATPARARWLRAELDETLEGLLPDAELELMPAAVRRVLRGAFELPARGDRPVTGGITVCSLEPMRSVPFRVIALLGMDDGVFPRGRPPTSWSPFATPEPGERDRREVDRHLLLEAVLSAQDHLLVFWDGFDLQRGEQRPAAVPIEELLDLLVDRSATEDAERKAWVHAWPMQPWSPRRFEAEMHPSFDADLAAAAADLETLRRGEGSAVPRGAAVAARARGAAPGALSAEPTPAELDAHKLARELYDGPSALLQRRLRVRQPEDVVALEEREPFDLDGLGIWGLADRALAMLLQAQGRAEAEPPDGGDPAADEVRNARIDAFEAVERGTGRLPHGLVGRAYCEDAFAQAEAAFSSLLMVLEDPSQARDGPLTAHVDEILLRCAPHFRLGGRMYWATASKRANAKLHLEGTAAALIARIALGDAADVMCTLVGQKATVTLVPPDREQSLVLIRALLQARASLRAEVRPIFARTSWALIEALGGVPPSASLPKERAAAQRAMMRAWAGDDYGGIAGDVSAPATAALWADWQPDDEIEALHAEAMVVYGPTLTLLGGGAP
ncbi:MAG: exodeoxyribonuclease V subunit gamma [Deltaproteobacteria bacterium]|nr:exodeoxyribonuclease V subunit gamma [Deltaproteobacteria bacterium]